MSKVNLILADSDSWYIEGLSNFIRNNHSLKFNVVVFTVKGHLQEYLANNAGKSDILLASPDMVYDGLEKNRTNSMIILADEISLVGYKEFPGINKYQPGDKILKELLDILSETDLSTQFIVKGNKRTRIVSVYSPTGGSGKTSISASIAVKMAKSGFKVFYLSLDSFDTTDLFLESGLNGKSLSEIIFYLKEDKKNLAMRIDAARCFDEATQLSFFKPANCAMEVDELVEEDIEKLLWALKHIGLYDIIVVDTFQALNKSSLAVLKNSDSILMVLLQDFISQRKLEIFQRDIRKVLPGSENEILKKIIPLVNKHTSDYSNREGCMNGQLVNFRIPYLKDVLIQDGGHYFINQASNMEIYLEDMLPALLAALGLEALEGAG